MTVTPEQHFLRYRERGDAEALGLVFDALAPELLLVAAHLAGGDHAEDVVQATFVDAIRQQDRWDAGRPLAPWLCGMLGLPPGSYTVKAMMMGEGVATVSFVVPAPSPVDNVVEVRIVRMQ